MVVKDEDYFHVLKPRTLFYGLTTNRKHRGKREGQGLEPSVLKYYKGKWVRWGQLLKDLPHP